MLIIQIISLVSHNTSHRVYLSPADCVATPQMEGGADLGSSGVELHNEFISQGNSLTRYLRLTPSLPSLIQRERVRSREIESVMGRKTSFLMLRITRRKISQ